jgi:hypothetical protein
MLLLRSSKISTTTSILVLLLLLQEGQAASPLSQLVGMLVHVHQKGVFIPFFGLDLFAIARLLQRERVELHGVKLHGST